MELNAGDKACYFELAVRPVLRGQPWDREKLAL